MAQFFLGLLIIAISTAIGAVGVFFGKNLASEGWKKIYSDSSALKTDVFGFKYYFSMKFKWPGPLIYVYSSSLGKTISPISIASWIEVTNKKEYISRITGYECKALMKYDEGGTINITKTPGGGLEYEYKPSGKIVENWRTLHNMGFLADQVYYVVNNDWRKCKKIDFRNNSFDILARNTQLNPGHSIMGWIFFEIENDLRGQLPEIKEIEMTLTNSAGDSQTFRHAIKPEGEERISEFISGGTWNILGGYYDLSKEEYNLIPRIDLHEMLKGKEYISINPSDLKSN